MPFLKQKAKHTNKLLAVVPNNSRLPFCESSSYSSLPMGMHHYLPCVTDEH